MKKSPLIIVTLCLLSLSPVMASAAEARNEPPPTEIKEVSDRLDAANERFSKGEIREAANAYLALLGEKLLPSTWGKVTFNLGIAQMRLKEYDAAIRTFETIFPSAVDDREVGGHIMEEFRNYRYRACLQIAACYEAKGDIARALASTTSAREKYQYEAHCGNCADNARRALDARVSALEKKQ